MLMSWFYSASFSWIWFMIFTCSFICYVPMSCYSASCWHWLTISYTLSCTCKSASPCSWSYWICKFCSSNILRSFSIWSWVSKMACCYSWSLPVWSAKPRCSVVEGAWLSPSALPTLSLAGSSTFWLSCWTLLSIVFNFFSASSCFGITFFLII